MRVAVRVGVLVKGGVGLAVRVGVGCRVNVRVAVTVAVEEGVGVDVAGSGVKVGGMGPFCIAQDHAPGRAQAAGLVAHLDRERGVAAGKLTVAVHQEAELRTALRRHEIGLSEAVERAGGVARRRHREPAGEVVQRVGDSLREGEVDGRDGGNSALVAHGAAAVAERPVDLDLQIRTPGRVSVLAVEHRRSDQSAAGAGAGLDHQVEAEARVAEVDLRAVLEAAEWWRRSPVGGGDAKEGDARAERGAGDVGHRDPAVQVRVGVGARRPRHGKEIARNGGAIGVVDLSIAVGVARNLGVYRRGPHQYDERDARAGEDEASDSGRGDLHRSILQSPPHPDLLPSGRKARELDLPARDGANVRKAA